MDMKLIAAGLSKTTADQWMYLCRLSNQRQSAAMAADFRLFENYGAAIRSYICGIESCKVISDKERENLADWFRNGARDMRELEIMAQAEKLMP